MQLLFFLFAFVTVIGALGMVLSRNIVHSALFLSSPSSGSRSSTSHCRHRF